MIVFFLLNSARQKTFRTIKKTSSNKRPSYSSLEGHKRIRYWGQLSPSPGCGTLRGLPPKTTQKQLSPWIDRITITILFSDVFKKQSGQGINGLVKHKIRFWSGWNFETWRKYIERKKMNRFFLIFNISWWLDFTKKVKIG